MPGRLIVTFEPAADSGARAAAHRRAGASVIDRIPAIGAEVVKVRAGDETRAVGLYRGAPGVQTAERDVIVRALHDDVDTAPVSDPYFSRLWGLENDSTTTQPPDTSARHDADIDARFAWGTTTGSGIRIAILDSGIDLNHEEFPRPGKVVKDINFSSSRSTEDKYGHGTHVAGTAAAPANNGKGVAGAAHAALLLNVKVLSDNGFGSCSAIANGITWSADPAKGNADVINLSLGGGACTAEENAVNYAASQDVVVAAAAGNSNANGVSCPACYENAIAVAATDNADLKASFSNYGAQVDIAAPGVKVFSTFPNHRNRIGKRNYDYGSGTSMATPHVAGAAALAWGPASNAAEVRARLEQHADHIAENDAWWSAGRLNACNAVAGSTTACTLQR